MPSVPVWHSVGGRLLSSGAPRGDHCVGALQHRPDPKQSPGTLALRANRRWLAGCLTIALAISLLGGQGGHLVFAKDDWLTRDAVLADLSTHWLPVIYSIDQNEYVLRAPIGMYLLPAAVGHVLGLNAAHFVQLAQNTVLFGGFLYVVTLVWPKKRLPLVFLFLLYAGAGVIPVLLATGGGWLPHYLVFWSAHWNYLSSLSQYFWNPNHALPGWWFAAFVLLHMRREIDLATLAAATAPMALWSPVSLITALPLFGLLAFQEPRQLLTSRFAVALVGLGSYLPVLAYLTIDSTRIRHEWLVFKEDFVTDYLIFVTFALPPAFFAAALSARLDPHFRRILLASVALLLLLPFGFIGTNARVNDLSQKGSIIPQAIVAFGFARLLVELPSSRPWLLGGFGAMLATVAAAEPALEIYDSLINPRYAVSDCNFLTQFWKLEPRQQFPWTYLARLEKSAGWVTPRDAVPIREEQRRCWPDRPQGDARYHPMAPENRLWLRAN